MPAYPIVIPVPLVAANSVVQIPIDEEAFLLSVNASLRSLLGGTLSLSLRRGDGSLLQAISMGSPRLDRLPQGPSYPLLGSGEILRLDVDGLGVTPSDCFVILWLQPVEFVEENRDAI